MNADRWSSLFWFALGAAGIYASARLGVGHTGEPGSGFVPLTASAFVCLMALLVFLQSFERGQARSLSALWKGVYWRRSLAVGAITLAYILALETLGFFLIGFLLLVITMKGLEGLGWKKTLIISISTLVVSYVVFKVLLKATLPVGILGF
ncbi:MAG: tripartite tricarboxylate transporter TctB family protein [Burkholderiales bacterium]|jgi:putative tricarboxylic transport membrane protein